MAMKLMRQKKAVVIPVILSPSSYGEEDFAKLENLPRKGEPVSSFNPRETAWTLVEEGIKKAVLRARGNAFLSCPRLASAVSRLEKYSVRAWRLEIADRTPSWRP